MTSSSGALADAPQLQSLEEKMAGYEEERVKVLGRIERLENKEAPTDEDREEVKRLQQEKQSLLDYIKQLQEKQNLLLRSFGSAGLQLDLVGRLVKANAERGGEGLAARLQRERGTAPWPLTDLEVLHIAATGDSSTIHCISPGCSNKVDIASALTAMAHQPHGGVVVLGLRSSVSPPEVVGCQADDMELVGDVLARYICPRIAADVAQLIIGKQQVIAIDVAPSEKVHGVGMGPDKLGYYMRYGVKMHRLTAREGEVLRQAFPRYSSDSSCVERAGIKYSSMCRCSDLGLVGEGAAVAEQESALIAAGLLHPSRKLLTRAGLLLTGVPKFQQLLPAASNFKIRAFYSLNSTSSAEAKALQDFRIKKDFDGPLIQQVEDSIAWVQLLEDTPYEKRLEVQQEGHTLYVGRGYKQYAPEALAEVLGNAVVHRDYDLVGQAIQLWMFRQSIELIVPGDLLPGAGDLNLQPRSDMRNLTIGLLLTRTEHPITKKRFFEGVGTGVASARKCQKELGGDLTFTVEPGQVVVRLKAAPTPRNTRGGA